MGRHRGPAKSFHLNLGTGEALYLRLHRNGLVEQVVPVLEIDWESSWRCDWSTTWLVVKLTKKLCMPTATAAQKAVENR